MNGKHRRAARGARPFFGRERRLIALLGALLTAAVLWSLAVGAASGKLWGMLSDALSGHPGAQGSIFLYVRLPRVCAALLAGSALAVAGLIIQSVLANPLAGPNIIGVNAGAGFAVVAVLALMPGALYLAPAAAFAGALAAAALIFVISRRTSSRLTLVLAGVALGSVLGAGTDALTTLYPDVLVGANSFKIGGFSGVTFDRLLPAALGIVPALIAACALHGALDVLALGDDTARSLGMNTRRVRGLMLTLAALLAGAAVSFAGLIGFVGLMVPHLIRMLMGENRRYMLLATLLCGALITLVCDTLSRVLFAPYELPVGILLSVLGGAFFVWLLISGRGGRSVD